MDVTSYETVAIVFPQAQQDVLLAMQHIRELWPQSYQKFFIGPVETRIFLLVHDGNDNEEFPMRTAIGHVTQRARALSKDVSIVRIAFGGKGKQTRVLESSDPKIVTDEDVNNRLKLSLLEGANKILKNQIEEMQRLRDRDVVLSEALLDLNYLGRQKELVAAVKEAGVELRANKQLSDQSAQRILTLLDDMEKLAGRERKSPEPTKPVKIAPWTPWED